MQTLNTSWNLYCCFSRDKQHFVSFITYHKQSFLLTFESTIDCSAFTMNFCLFFLPRFLLKTAFGKVFSVTLALQPIRSFGQIGVDFMSSMWYFCCCSSDANSTRNYCSSRAANSQLFFELKKNENCNLLFCRMLYFLGHVAGCSSSCGRRTWMEWWPVLSQSTRIIWYWQTTPWKRVQGIRSPNKGQIGQEMARKFGLLCLVQVSNFFLQVAKIYEFSIPLLDP